MHVIQSSRPKTHVKVKTTTHPNAGNQEGTISSNLKLPLRLAEAKKP